MRYNYIIFRNSKSAMENNVVRQQMAAAQFASKYKSKRECHRFLSVEVGAYIPPLSNVTIYHMRDLIAGQKKVSGQSNIF